MINKIKKTFFEFLNGFISLENIEDFIFFNIDEIKNIFSKEDYFYIIDFDFKDKNSYKRIEDLILKYINISEFEVYRLITILENICNIDNLLKIYDEYCKGYYFLDILAIDYALDLSTAIYELEISKDDLNSKINNLSTNLIFEANKIISYLKNEKIVIKNNYLYQDFRNTIEIEDQKRKIPKYFTS